MIEVEFVNLSEHHDDCVCCGASIRVDVSSLGIPMYEGMVLPNSWGGEWVGYPACQRCFDIQQILVVPADMVLFAKKKISPAKNENLGV